MNAVNPNYRPVGAQQAGMYHARKRNRLMPATVNSRVAPAWGTITFPANPANLATITINGTVITFVSGTPSGAQVKIGADLPTTLTSLLTYIGANPISGAFVSLSGNGILVQSTKPADTTVTLAASAATVSSANLVPQIVRARPDMDHIGVLP